MRMFLNLNSSLNSYFWSQFRRLLIEVVNIQIFVDNFHVFSILFALFDKID